MQTYPANAVFEWRCFDNRIYHVVIVQVGAFTFQAICLDYSGPGICNRMAKAVVLDSEYVTVDTRTFTDDQFSQMMAGEKVVYNPDKRLGVIFDIS